MRIAEVDILLLPGLGNSGPGHWQRRWAARFPNGHVVEQDDWDHPQRDRWIARIIEEVAAAARPVVLVAHSLAVLAVVHAAPALPPGKVRGAFLVSPPDEHGPDFPPEALAFAGVPADPLPFPSMLVVSANDALTSPERAAGMAAAWGSEMHLAGNAGHINAASGHGPWPEGLMMFTRLMQRV
jgi:predicted alpha/beta hydrolase family esterase